MKKLAEGSQPHGFLVLHKYIPPTPAPAIGDHRFSLRLQELRDAAVAAGVTDDGDAREADTPPSGTGRTVVVRTTGPEEAPVGLKGKAPV